MNYAQELQKIFYERNPELLEVEFGCEILCKKKPEDNWIRYNLDWSTTAEHDPTDHDYITVSQPEYRDSHYDYFDIKGKPITTLQAISLLQWSEDDRYENITMNNVNGESYIRFTAPKGTWTTFVDEEDGTVGENADWFDIKIDPTIALVKDLPQETQKQLYELINNN